MTHELYPIILAAGKGTRMKSRLPKVLHALAGKPLLAHVLDAVAELTATQTTVVIGHGAEEVQAAFPDPALRFVVQEPQNGTGHAVQLALADLPERGICLILTGDTPLIAPSTLRQLVALAQADTRLQTLALLTCVLDDPTGYGRILRNAAGEVVRIVEHKDALAQGDAATLAVREINAGVIAAPTAWLKQAVGRLQPNNAQGELYLTDVIGLAAVEGLAIATLAAQDPLEIEGVNDKSQLARLERGYQRRLAERLMQDGVTLADPARIDIRGSLRCARDVAIDVGCVFEGVVELGEGVVIGPNCLLRDCTIGSGTRIEAFCHLEGASVGTEARIGPYARLRPGARLAEGVHIGNFVEVKNSRLGPGSKANHLAYLGDAEVGAEVNYGAGSITANYDGANKHRTVIGDRVHVGSNCVLVAPVSIGAGGTVGAGSTITKDTPEDALTVARSKPVTIPGWKRPQKKP